MNKKGSISFDTVEFVVKIIILITALLFLTMIIKGYFTSQVDISSTRSIIELQRVISSKNIIHYDNTTKVYEQGVIDWSKFKYDNINKTFSIDRKNTLLAMNLTLTNSSGSVKTIIFNKKYYKDMLARSTVAGATVTIRYAWTLPILIYQNGKENLGTLNATIITPYSR